MAITEEVRLRARRVVRQACSLLLLNAKRGLKIDGMMNVALETRGVCPSLLTVKTYPSAVAQDELECCGWGEGDFASVGGSGGDCQGSRQVSELVDAVYVLRISLSYR